MVGDETEVPLLEREEDKFNIVSSAVETGERLQEMHYNTSVRQKFAGTCPFKGLKADLLLTEDKIKLMTWIMNERNFDWNDLGCSFNLGCNAGVRGDTTRSLKLKDLYVSHGFAPGQGRSLTIILRKDEQKVHFVSDRLVGCLRHKHYLLCPIFMSSMNIVKLLLIEQDRIHFLNQNPKEGAPWWTFDFVVFNNLNDEANAMAEIYKQTGVESHKVTHHRSHCVMHASTEGLQQHQVSTLTKHMNDKINKSYWAEMERQTMCVMAGFEMKSSVKY